MSEYVGIAELAREKGIPPRAISDLFYRGRLNTAVCPVISGRRLIPRDYVPLVEAELRRAGKLPQGREAAHA